MEPDEVRYEGEFPGVVENNGVHWVKGTMICVEWVQLASLDDVTNEYIASYFRVPLSWIEEILEFKPVEKPKRGRKSKKA